MSENKKYFIITAGATGSGKTGLIDATMKYLNIPSNEPFAKILVDDLVENDPKYKKKVNAIIKNVHNKCENDTKCETNAYNNPESIKAEKSVDLFKDFGDAYFTTRKTPGCLSESENTNAPTCDELNDDNIKKSEEEGKHIIFEFTGYYIPNWLLNPDWIPNDYNIVFSYSLVTLENLIKRNKSRAYSAIEKFEEDNTNPAPRLPDVSNETLKKVVTNIKNVLIDLYDSCVLHHNDEKCGSKKIDQLLLFDNNGSSLKHVFDSQKDAKTKQEFINKIGPSFGNDITGGAKKRKTRALKKKKNKSKRKPVLV